MTVVRRERLAADTARPLMLHMTWVFIGLGIVFMTAAGSFVLIGMYRSLVAGQPVDWQGMGYVITAMGGAGGILLPILINLLRDRRIQRVEEIRAGVPAQSPLPLPPSPDGGARPGDSP